MPAPWNRDDDMLRLTPDERQSYSEVADAFYERVSARHDAGPDCAMGDLIEPTDRWRPPAGCDQHLCQRCGTRSRVVRDHDEYQPGDGPRLAGGRGLRHADLGLRSRLPVVLDAAATSIDHTDRNVVRVDTERGRVCAKAIVVTVSTSVLAAELIRFRPALPDKIAAAAKLPLGVANKIYLGLDRADTIAPETYKIGSILTARTGAYHLRPFGRPVIECFYGGELARDLEAQGKAAFRGSCDGRARRALRQRRESTPVPDPLDGVGRRALHRWLIFLCGARSLGLPGGPGAAVDDRLFFAGEACSPHKNTTAHGAFESGVAAAEAVLAALLPATAAMTTRP